MTQYYVPQLVLPSESKSMNISGKYTPNGMHHLPKAGSIKNPLRENNKKNLKKKMHNNDTNATQKKTNSINVNGSATAVIINERNTRNNVPANKLEEQTIKYSTKNSHKCGKQISLKRYQHKKIIVLDYDDTILPTTWITVHNNLTLYDAVPAHMQQSFQKLSKVVICTLELCVIQGTVIIVTNASLEWLINSAKTFIPQVWKFIVYNRIQIISARDQLINTSLDPQDWKKVIFHNIVNEMLFPFIHDGSFICCLYSVGDGNDERNACFSLSQTDRYSSCVFKSLKFLAEPNCEKLIAEHEMLRQFFLNNINN